MLTGFNGGNPTNRFFFLIKALLSSGSDSRNSVVAWCAALEGFRGDRSFDD